MPQDQLIQALQDSSYRSDNDGVCSGFSYMSLLSIFTHDDIAPLESYVNVIYKEDGLPTLLNKKIQTSFLSDLKAFLEGIELCQQAEYYSDFLLDSEDPEDIDNILPLLSTKAIESQGGIVTVGEVYSGSYDQRDLEKYFTELSDVIENKSFNANIPIGFILSNLDHQILIAYSTKKQKWIHINANSLPKIHYLNDYQMAKRVLMSFSDNDIAVFTTKVYTLNSHKKLVEELLFDLSNRYNWDEIHEITRKKFMRYDSEGLGWLDLAVVEHLNKIVAKAVNGNFVDLRHERNDKKNALYCSVEVENFDALNLLMNYLYTEDLENAIELAVELGDETTWQLLVKAKAIHLNYIESPDDLPVLETNYSPRVSF